MKWLETKVQSSLPLNTRTVDRCHLFGCSFHQYDFVSDEKGYVYYLQEGDRIMKLPDSIEQVVVSCHREGGCQYYIRTVLKDVYIWKLSNSEQLRRDHDLHLQRLGSMTDFLIPSSEGVYLCNGQKFLNPGYNITLITPMNGEITYGCSIKDSIHSVLSFFSIHNHTQGIVYGTRAGCVYFLDVKKNEEKKIYVFEQKQEVKYINLFHANHSSHLLIIGSHGSIVLYQQNTTTTLEQFNVQGPIFAIDQINDTLYMVSTGIGRLFTIHIKIGTQGMELESTLLAGFKDVCRLRLSNKEDYVLDILQRNPNCIAHRVRYNPVPVSIDNDPMALNTVIADTLKELEMSEITIKALDKEELELNASLTSTNHTLYALSHIKIKRDKRIGNTLKSTGFELTAQPILKNYSMTNSVSHSTTYIRISIKTSEFLKLEDWTVCLHLTEEDLSPIQQSCSAVGEMKIIPIIGFQPLYENGIERYLLWERDVEIDIRRVSLPLIAKVYLQMNVDNADPLDFPVYEMLIDDIHFASPISKDIITSIKRKGLQEVSNELMKSLDKQRVHDNTAQFPFTRMIRRHLSKTSDMNTDKSIFNYRVSHIKCEVDPHIPLSKIQSLLSYLISEGHPHEQVMDMMDSVDTAYLTLASYPGIPVIIRICKESSNKVDIIIECSHIPALFRTEATLLTRIYILCMNYGGNEEEKTMGRVIHDEGNIINRLNQIERSIAEAGDVYESKESIHGSEESSHSLKEDAMDIDSLPNVQDNDWGNIGQSMDKLLGVSNEICLGYIDVNVIIPIN